MCRDAHRLARETVLSKDVKVTDSVWRMLTSRFGGELVASVMASAQVKVNLKSTCLLSLEGTKQKIDTAIAWLGRLKEESVTSSILLGFGLIHPEEIKCHLEDNFLVTVDFNSSLEGLRCRILGPQSEVADAAGWLVQTLSSTSNRTERYLHPEPAHPPPPPPSTDATVQRQEFPTYKDLVALGYSRRAIYRVFRTSGSWQFLEVL